MSYIRIDIGGKNRGLKFNTYAMKQFSLNFTKYEKLNDKDHELFFVYNIFASGLEGNCYVKNEEPDFTFLNVMEWVDELYEQGNDEERQAVIDTFSQSRTFRDATKAVSDVAEKKSQHEETSKIIGMTV